jgi:hypothetical protein
MAGSIQIFALLDYVSQVTPGFREEHGFHQYESLAVFLNTIFRLTDDVPAGPMQHIFGFLPFMLFVVGVMTRCRPKCWNIYDLAGALTIGAYVLKCFPVWPQFNQAVGQVPLLLQRGCFGFVLSLLNSLDKRDYLRGLSFRDFARRTPGPPPFSSMNSTPAFFSVAAINSKDVASPA